MKKAFTLIELILYLALVAIFLTGAISFSWDVIFGREKAMQVQVAEQSARLAMERIAYEVRRAAAVNSLTASSLVLEAGVHDTTISLADGVIQLTADGVGPLALTSNQVTVTELAFANLSSANSQTKNIQVALSLTRGSANASAVQAVELNSQFNQSRQLLVNASGLTLSANNKDLLGITLQNSGSADLVIDKIYLSWTGTAGGENLTQVQINGGAIEWSGTAASGSTVDIANYTLTSVAGIVALDNLTFSASMANALMDFQFILADGSISRVTLNPSGTEASPLPSPSASPGASPFPSASPSPSPTTCLGVCQANSYPASACRANASVCTAQGEINLPAGDIFCTGGSSADTCCCK